jgi:hypothetical protein
MKRLTTIMLIVCIASCALLALPLSIGIWLPDVFTDSEHVLAERQLASGHSFRVVQYWNRVDFYTTLLRHTSPDGTLETFVLDGDDGKSWSTPLVINEETRSARITLRGGRVKRVFWN